MVNPDRKPLMLRRPVAEEAEDVVSATKKAVVEEELVVEATDRKPAEMGTNATMRIVAVIGTMERVRKEKRPEVWVAVAAEVAVETVATLALSKTRTRGSTSTTTWRDQNTNE